MNDIWTYLENWDSLFISLFFHLVCFLLSIPTAASVGTALIGIRAQVPSLHFTINMPPKTRQAAVRERNMKDIQIEELHKKIEKLWLQIEEQARGASTPSGSTVPSLDEETSK